MTLANVGPAITRKLTNMLGDAKAEQLAADVLRAIGHTSLVTPDDRMLFGEELVHRGGIFAVIGRSIQTQALLHGAVTTADRTLGHRPRPE